MDAFTSALVTSLSTTIPADLAGIAPVAGIILTAVIGWSLVKRFK